MTPEYLDMAKKALMILDMPQDSYWTYNNWEDCRERFIKEVAKHLSDLADKVREEAIDIVWQTSIVDGSQLPILKWKQAVEKAIRAKKINQ